jgi:hypothetical protein
MESRCDERVGVGVYDMDEYPNWRLIVEATDQRKQHLEH